MADLCGLNRFEGVLFNTAAERNELLIISHLFLLLLDFRDECRFLIRPKYRLFDWRLSRNYVVAGYWLWSTESTLPLFGPAGAENLRLKARMNYIQDGFPIFSRYCSLRFGVSKWINTAIEKKKNVLFGFALALSLDRSEENDGSRPPRSSFESCPSWYQVAEVEAWGPGFCGSKRVHLSRLEAK